MSKVWNSLTNPSLNLLNPEQLQNQHMTHLPNYKLCLKMKQMLCSLGLWNLHHYTHL